MSPSLVVVANADAGTADADAVRAALSVLRQGAAPELRETSTPEELDEVVSELEGRTLVVAGGDGSLHAAVNALHRANLLTGATVGLIPLGTGNDMSRTVGIPRDPVEAARVVLDGTATPHELLERHEPPDAAPSVSINAVHLGIGAEAVRLGARAKQQLGPAGYPIGAALAGVRFAGWNLDVTVDGVRQPRDGRVLMVGISIGQTIGGGAPLAPDADVSDGFADVTIASTTGALQRVRFATRLRSGSHHELPDVHAVRGTHIAIEGDTVRANEDGELADPRTRWAWTVRPRAWRLIHPART
jgi:diacylglycerol kinase family enzyme